MARYRITVSEECIGCGQCVSACDNFEMKEGVSVPVKEIVEDKGCNEAAADLCPVGAIQIEEVE